LPDEAHEQRMKLGGHAARRARPARLRRRRRVLPRRPGEGGHHPPTVVVVLAALIAGHGYSYTAKTRFLARSAPASAGAHRGTSRQAAATQTPSSTFAASRTAASMRLASGLPSTPGMTS